MTEAEALRAAARAYWLRMAKKYAGNVTAMADESGLLRSSIYPRLKLLGIEPRSFRPPPKPARPITRRRGNESRVYGAVMFSRASRRPAV
jgi:hypothetical protein